MKKNLTKKLMLSVLTLAFAVVSLGASTFAWFTLSKDAEVEAFSAEVIGGSGLEIAVLEKGADIATAKWNTAYLSGDQIKAVYDNDPTTPFKFDAVAPQITAAGKISAFEDHKSNSVGSGWIQFDLAFKLTNTADSNKYPLYFDGYTFASSGQQGWTVNKEFTGKTGTYSVGDVKTYLVQDAARLAISVTNAGAYSTLEEKIYEAVSGSDEFTTGYVTTGAQSYYNAVNQDKLTPNDWEKVVDDKGNEDPSDDVKETVKGDRDAYTISAAPGEKTAGLVIGHLTGEQIVRLTVYVWVDGWDGECINAIFSQKLATSLSFYLDTDNKLS